MMRKIVSLLALFFLFFKSYGQVTKGNWLVGGNATIEKQQEKLFGSDVNSLRVVVSPDLAYFFANKFAAGLKPSFAFIKLKTFGVTSKTTSIGIGPFARYYFLPVDNRTNLFAESGYQYLTDFNGYSQNGFIFSAGPVIYFNTSVGIEFTLNYEIFHTNGSITSTKTFFIGIGFQIHLAKEKNL